MDDISQLGEAELLAAVRGTRPTLLPQIALEELLRRNYAWVLRACLVELRDSQAAFDCAQEIMIAATLGIGGFRGRASFRTWLFVVSKRTIQHFRRREQRKLVAIETETVEATLSDTNAEDLLAAREDSRVLLRAVRTLPEKQREVIRLHYFEGLSVEETAAILGCSPNTCKVHLFRARKNLLRQLQGV